MIKCRDLDLKFVRQKALKGLVLNGDKCICVTEKLILFFWGLVLRRGGGEIMQVRKLEKTVRQEVYHC